MKLKLNNVKAEIDQIGKDNFKAQIDNPTLGVVTFHKIKANLWQVYFWDKSLKKQVFLQRLPNGAYSSDSGQSFLLIPDVCSGRIRTL